MKILNPERPENSLPLKMNVVKISLLLLVFFIFDKYYMMKILCAKRPIYSSRNKGI